MMFYRVTQPVDYYFRNGQVRIAHTEVYDIEFFTVSFQFKSVYSRKYVRRKLC